MRASWAKIDAAIASDPKVVKLARRYQNGDQTMVALGLYLSAVLASWREDGPVTVADAAPAWFLEPVEGYVAELAAVGLTDPTGAISQETLDRWMESARASSEHARHAARSRWDNAAAVPKSARAMQIDREIDRERERKGYKTRSSRARGAAPEGAPRAFGEIMTEMGLDPKVAKREASS